MEAKSSLMKRTSLTLLSLLAIPFLSTAGEPVASDDFSGGELSESWTAAKGTWKVVDGKLSGVELASDKHAAVLFYPAPHANSKVRISFQLNGSNSFNLSYNHPKGHLFRVAVTEEGAMLVMDKDKKDPESKREILEKKDGAFEQGKTYTITCETLGDTATVEFDNGLTLKGTHEGLAKEKTGYRLVLKGEGVLFDDFAILGQ